MVDILHKNFTRRTAIAVAEVQTSSIETIKAIEEKRIPKGDVFEFARAAGLLAIKKTSDLIPDCHPLPIEYANISYEIKGLSIFITVEVATIYKTGVEVEAMHGASLVALTMYDMLKPIDKFLEIKNIKLVEKKGGKSSFKNDIHVELKIAVVVCSDSVFAGKKEDRAGKIIMDHLQRYKLDTNHYQVIPDEKNRIQEVVMNYVNQNYDLVWITGGTGLSPRDVTPEAINEILERPIPGIMEAARQYGQLRTPYAMLSRGIAGMIQKTLVITLPGSTKGAQESIEAIFPAILHIFKVQEGSRHD